MKVPKMPETVIDWSRAQAITVPGLSAAASVRAHQAGEVQTRVVDYAPGYLADHWCSKGHILYVISGELAIEHEDGGAPHLLLAGMSWQVGDDATPAHRVRSATGARIFIVD